MDYKTLIEQLHSNVESKDLKIEEPLCGVFELTYRDQTIYRGKSIVKMAESAIKFKP